jgi:hypothetical protein
VADLLARIAPERLAAIALLGLTLVSVYAWWTTLSRVAGGADSYGYVSESQLILRGSLVQRPIQIDRLPLERGDALAVGSPLGYVPSIAVDGIVPVYPPGLPLLMALATLLAGAEGPFYVAPVMGIVGVALVFLIARLWFDMPTSALAAAWVAWNPVYVAYARQPMSDVPATALILAAVFLMMRTPPSPAAAGVAAAAALLTRPALLLAVGALAGNGARRLFAQSGTLGVRFLLRFGSICAVAVVVQLVAQWTLYGHPFQSGYGSAALLFSLDRLPGNLAVYARWTLATHGWLWLVAVALGLLLVRAAEPRELAVSVALAAALPYLFYLEFDHWETLRFLLPGLVMLTIVAAAGLTTGLQRLNARWTAMRPLTRISHPLWTRIAVRARGARRKDTRNQPGAQRERNVQGSALGWVGALALVGCGAAFAVQSNRWLDRQGTWRLADVEARYPLAARWVREVTSPDAMVMAAQHSGSIRHYAGRFTLRWDVLTPEALLPTLRELHAQNIDVFAVFEGVELDRFRERFRAVLDRVDLLPAGQARGVILVELRLHPDSPLSSLELSIHPLERPSVHAGFPQIRRAVRLTLK